MASQANMDSDAPLAFIHRPTDYRSSHDFTKLTLLIQEIIIFAQENNEFLIWLRMTLQS